MICASCGHDFKVGHMGGETRGSSNCPKCGTIPVDIGSPTGEKLQAIKVLCQRYNGPHVITPVHTLAGKVLAIIEGR